MIGVLRDRSKRQRSALETATLLRAKGIGLEPRRLLLRAVLREDVAIRIDQVVAVLARRSIERLERLVLDDLDEPGPVIEARLSNAGDVAHHRAGRRLEEESIARPEKAETPGVVQTPGVPKIDRP